MQWEIFGTLSLYSKANSVFAELPLLTDSSTQIQEIEIHRDGDYVVDNKNAITINDDYIADENTTEDIFEDDWVQLISNNRCESFYSGPCDDSINNIINQTRATMENQVGCLRCGKIGHTFTECFEHSSQ